MSLTQNLLKELFDYKEGNLIRKIKAGTRGPVGSTAGSKHNSGYVLTKVNGVTYRLHRLVYMWHHGDIPKGLTVDHINMIKHDNRVENLRLLSIQDNKKAATVVKGRTNKSGIVGVSFHKHSGKWVAQISKNKKPTVIGYFDTIEEATLARKTEELLEGYDLLHNTF